MTDLVLVAYKPVSYKKNVYDDLKIVRLSYLRHRTVWTKFPYTRANELFPKFYIQTDNLLLLCSTVHLALTACLKQRLGITKIFCRK